MWRLPRMLLGANGLACGVAARRSLCESAEQPGYRLPPDAIVALAEARPVPAVSVQPRACEKALYLHRPAMLTLEDMSNPVLKLGGARFNPSTLVAQAANAPAFYYTHLEVQDICTAERRAVSGVPEGARMNHFHWSPDGSKCAFSLRVAEQCDGAAMQLWMLDVASASAAPVGTQRLNGVLGNPFVWCPDSSTLVIKRPVGTRADEPVAERVPASPLVQHSTRGAAAAVRTYPNLLVDESDAALFRHYATVQLVRLSLLANGEISEHAIGQPMMATSLSVSPDGSQLLATSVRPDGASYSVPWSRFGRRVELLPLQARAVSKVLNEAAAVETLPIGHDAVRAGPRLHGWRADKPATLCWAEALDGGNPKAKADGGHRDRLLLLPAPYDRPHELTRTRTRFEAVRWGADGSALIWERWHHARSTRITRVPPGGGVPTNYLQYDYSDAYNHPGTPLMEEGPYGRQVLRRHGDSELLWSGDGASELGARPFIDVRGLADGAKRARLWRAATGCYEAVGVVLSAAAAQRVAPAAAADAVLLVLTERETCEQPAQLLLRRVSAASAARADSDAVDDSSTLLVTLSDPPHPQPRLVGVGKSLVRYERADGVQLSGTLYTPAGYDAARDGPLPTLMWAYPREFRSKGTASQVRGSEHQFKFLNWGSPLFWLARGYAVFDGFAVPIVGEGDTHENDGYVTQLVQSAEAAVAELRRRGVSDHRLAVGGHSYGAFMAANLLARTDLFLAGIARNGAYNRTLTPFGFQSEERSFWEAADTYGAMSPFQHANLIRAPLLLIHGAADPNPGTFPMQSERMYAAIKGLGGEVRLCILPNEGHFYRGRESVLHTLAEQDAWLEAHVRNAPLPPPPHSKL